MSTKLHAKIAVNLLIALLFVWLLIHPGRPQDLVYTISTTVMYTCLIIAFIRRSARAWRQMNSI
jgi:hypothetical protein